MLIQSENFSEEQMAYLQKINEAAIRLSRLNTALLTLTKIENQQYTQEEKINLASFLRKKIDDLEEFIQQKNIKVSLQADEDVYINMNASLADLLFGNLIRNSMKHNIDGGFISISVQQHRFSISNSGKPLDVPAEELFERFVKNDPSSESLGLGLAMVKQICNNYHFNISFISKNNVYTIEISF